MSENNDLQRQEKKKKLKRNFVPDLSPGDREDLEQSLHERNQRRALIVLAVIVSFVLIVVLAHWISTEQKFTKAEPVWQKDGVGSENATYSVFGKQILKVTGDGVQALDTSGNVIWNYGYSMQSPRVIVRDRYGAVADIQSQTAVIFDASGVTGTVTTTQPILSFSVSDHGVLVLETDDTDASYINFYDRSGAVLDIRIKTKLDGDGFPLALSVSPKGTGLMASMIRLEEGVLRNRVLFYNFDVGKNESDRVVGKFDYNTTMFADVQYLSDSRAVAFGDNQVNIYSLRNERSPSLVKSIECSAAILSVFTSDSRIGVVTQEGTSGMTLRVYDDDGRRKFETGLSFRFDEAEFSGSYAVFCNGNECLILSPGGRVKYQGKMQASIQKLIMTGSDSCLIFSGTAMEKVKLSG